jgi:hypothetical protein
MSLQTLFRNAAQLERFEEIARNKGFTVFTKRGGFYCLTTLNDFAAGYVAGQEEALKNVITVGDGLSGEELRDLVQRHVVQEDVTDVHSAIGQRKIEDEDLAA